MGLRLAVRDRRGEEEADVAEVLVQLLGLLGQLDDRSGGGPSPGTPAPADPAPAPEPLGALAPSMLAVAQAFRTGDANVLNDVLGHLAAELDSMETTDSDGAADVRPGRLARRHVGPPRVELRPTGRTMRADRVHKPGSVSPTRGSRRSVSQNR